MNAKPPATVRVTHRYEASPERVFDAWLNPEKARKWLFTVAGPLVRCEIDARVGGSFTLTDRRDSLDIEHVGTYLEIDRPHRLKFTFSVPYYSKEITTVTIDIVQRGTGCELTLTHENVLADYKDRTIEGWTGLLTKLAENY